MRVDLQECRFRAAAGFRLLAGLVWIFCLLAGCSPRAIMIGEYRKIMASGLASFEQDDDLDMLQQAFPANIKLLEAMLASDPDDPGLLILLSRMYASYTFLFLEAQLDSANLEAPDAGGPTSAGGDPEIIKAALNRNYLKGAGYALAALSQRRPHSAQRLSKVNQVPDYLASLGREDVPALFWYGFNLGTWIHRNMDSVQAIAKANVAERVMKRVLELEPEYYHGSAHLFLLGFYASRPPMLGGNLEAALHHYQALRKIAGEDFLMARLYYARYVLPMKQDRRSYEKMLSAIIQEATDNPTTRYRLLNLVAARRARNFLILGDRLFE